jgi:hypothetical protein
MDTTALMIGLPIMAAYGIFWILVAITGWNAGSRIWQLLETPEEKRERARKDRSKAIAKAKKKAEQELIRSCPRTWSMIVQNICLYWGWFAVLCLVLSWDIEIFRGMIVPALLVWVPASIMTRRRIKAYLKCSTTQQATTPQAWVNIMRIEA